MTARSSQIAAHTASRRHPCIIASTMLAVAALLLPFSDTGLSAQTVAEGPIPDVIDYDVSLALDFDRKEIVGRETITIVSPEGHRLELRLSAADLTIDSVTIDGRAGRFTHEENSLTIPLPASAAGSRLMVGLLYRGRPSSGLIFHGSQAFTAFNTERWLVCNPDPADKATLTIRLTIPDTLMVVASGREISRRPAGGGRSLHVWRSETPYSAYLFGFAAGPFTDTTVTSNGRRYRYLGTSSRTDLARIFDVTPQAFRYFEQRAGIALPDTTYTQVLVAGNVEQEIATMAFLRQSYGGEVLDDPREDWLIAHEAAHQWWGNMLTCRSWSEIWLNEGLATFMTAAFKEFYWGAEEYEREMVMGRLRYERARAQGRNRPLTFTEWSTPQEANSPIAYYKGAVVLNYLRFVLGEEAFWRGIRTYTQTNFGKTVTSADLRNAMEMASGKDLSRFFTAWVDSAAVPELSATHRIEGNEVVIQIESGRWTSELPLRVAVESTDGRRTERVLLRQSTTTVRIPVSGSLLSVRVDDGGFLPVRVRHARPLEMLLWQAGSEPDVAGRVDAIMETEKQIANRDAARDASDRLRTIAETDRSRLVRQIAGQIVANLEKRFGK